MGLLLRNESACCRWPVTIIAGVVLVWVLVRMMLVVTAGYCGAMVRL